MRKTLLAVIAVAVLPALASADNIGQCGWGSKVMHGQRGIAPQVLAATTNGTSGNQTFAITSGTSGCSQNGTVTSSWKTAMFIDGNATKLARDMAVGEGEAIESLASLMEMNEADKARFFRLAKANFETIFSSENTTSREIMASLRTVLSQDAELSDTLRIYRYPSKRG